MRPRPILTAALTLVCAALWSCDSPQAQAQAPAKQRIARALTAKQRRAFLDDALASVPSGDPDKTLSPYFFVFSDDPAVDRLPLEETSVEIDVAAAIAEVDVTQVYRNDGARALEAIYVFPMSTRAAVHAMRMTVGERVIEADVRERKAARRRYEAARANGQTASLLEEQRPNVLQMSLANIQPGDEIRVELSYTELLVPEDGRTELVFPTVVGPRYGGGTRAGSDGSDGSDGADGYVKSPYLHAGEADFAGFSLRASVHGGVPLAFVSSPSHDIDVEYADRADAEIELAPGEEEKRRDFVLRYGLAGGAIESGLLVSPGEGESHFLLAVEPPSRVAAADVQPREYVFIADVSGSMSGFPLDTSKALLGRLLRDLRPTDSFDVLLFSGGSAVLSESSLPATPDNIERGVRFIDERQGGGGTELLPALQRAYGLPRVDGSARVVVLATDGYVAVEDEAFALTREELGRANLFVFGIGTSVNRELIEGLARAGEGAPFVVSDPGEAATACEKLAKYVGAPLLTEVAVRFDGADAFDFEPAHVPDLFAARPIVVAGKIRGPLAGSVTVSGRTPAGAWSRTIDLSAAKASEIGDAARLYWARERIRLLTDRYAVSEDDDLEKQIVRLGLAHHLLTRFTSFVAVDKVVRGDGRTVKVKQPLPMPDGVSDLAVGDSFGYGGLGISGTGRGGGGTGYGSIGLGSVSTIGHGAGTGTGSGYGYGRGSVSYSAKAAAAPSIRAGAAIVTGSLSKDVIRRVVRRHANEVRFCYEKGLAAEPALTGRVVIKLVIDAQGRVTMAAVAETTLNEPNVEACIVAAVRRWIFPGIPGGGTAVVNYPFELKPEQK
jgi:Ca-activated chloride channel homolog